MVVLVSLYCWHFCIDKDTLKKRQQLLVSKEEKLIYIVLNKYNIQSDKINHHGYGFMKVNSLK